MVRLEELERMREGALLTEIRRLPQSFKTNFIYLGCMLKINLKFVALKLPLLGCAIVLILFYTFQIFP